MTRNSRRGVAPADGHVRIFLSGGGVPSADASLRDLIHAACDLAEMPPHAPAIAYSHGHASESAVPGMRLATITAVAIRRGATFASSDSVVIGPNPVRHVIAGNTNRIVLASPFLPAGNGGRKLAALPDEKPTAASAAPRPIMAAKSASWEGVPIPAE